MTVQEALERLRAGQALRGLSYPEVDHLMEQLERLAPELGLLATGDRRGLWRLEAMEVRS